MSQALTDGTGLAGMVSVLRRVASAPAAFVDLRGSLLASAPSRTQWPLQELRAWKPGVTSVGTPACLARPVMLEGDLVALLVVRTETDNEAIFQVAVELASLELARLQALLLGRRELAGQVLEDIFAGRTRGDEALDRLASIGVSLIAGHRHVVIVGRSSLPTARVRSRPSNLHSLLSGGGDPYVRATVDDDVVLVVPASDSVDTVAKLLLQHLREKDPSAAVGVGHPASDPLTLSMSFHQAQEASKAGGISQAGPFNLGNLLVGMASAVPLREFALRELEPLTTHDRENGGELLHSLAVYLETDCSISEAATRLFIHRNTLRYRLNLITKLTQWSPDSFDGRMHFWVAIRSLTDGRDSLSAAVSQGAKL